MAEPLHLRTDLKHTQNRLLYDGLGGIAKQSQTGVSPGISWDAWEDLNLDAEYSYRFGENSYAEHEVSSAFMYSGFSAIRFGGDVSYGVRNYVFPTTGNAISANSTAMTLDVVPIPFDWLEMPLSGSYVTSTFSTNASAYKVYSLSGGINLILAERRLRIGLDVAPGFDSSNYTLLGGAMRASYRVFENISIRAFASVTTYSFSAPATTHGNNRSGNARVNPLGNTDNFQILLAGLETSYSF